MTTNSTAGPTALGSSALGASALYGALGALWAYGAAIAVASGWQPTPFRSPQAWPYPTQAVLGVIVLVSAEVALLYAILRPKSYAASWRRLAGAIGACFRTLSLGGRAGRLQSSGLRLCERGLPGNRNLSVRGTLSHTRSLVPSLVSAAHRAQACRLTSA